MLDFAAATRLARELDQMPLLAAWAQLSTQPGAGRRGARVSGATRTPPVPLRLDVASYLGPVPASTSATIDPHRDHDGTVPILGTLTAWARIIEEEMPCSCRHHRHACRPNESTIGSLLAYLARRDVLAWAVLQPWADEYATEIHDAWRTLDRLAAIRPRRRALQLPCPRCGLLSLSQLDGDDIRCGNESCWRVMRQAEYDQRCEAYLNALNAA
jgi:hypothetical protein